MYELIYTSTPQGLITGRSGFTTVALTEGFPPNLIAPVENLSGYKTLFQPGDSNDNFNPVNFSCQHFHLGRTPYIVLSRIAFAGLSYTGRSNVLAHHMLFQPDELDDIPGGAVSVLRSQENFPPWSGSPRMLPRKRKVGTVPLPQENRMWQKLAGDGRWAQYTAECFASSPERSFALAFDPLQIHGNDLLELIAETAASLSTDELRRFTFSTYCYSSGVSNPLFFRSYEKSSLQLGSIRRLDPSSVITLGAVNPLPELWCERKNAHQEVVTLYAEEETLPAPEEESSQPEEPQVIFNVDLPSPPPLDQPREIARSEENISVAVYIERKQVAQEYEQEEENAGSARWIIVILLICVVTGLLALLAWRIFFAGGGSKENNESASDLLLKDAIAVSQTDQKASQRSMEFSPQKPPLEKIVPPKIRSVAVKKKVPAQAAKPSSGISFGELSPQQEFELYRNFYQGETFRLPTGLRESTALELEIDAVGGSRDVRELKRFVSGNKTALVSIYSKREQNTGLMVEWEIDRTPGGMLTFQLSPRGTLSIGQVRKITDNSPRVSDITRFAFISPRGQRYELMLRKLPASIFAALNDRKILTAVCSDMKINCILKLSEDLWIFRNFCTIRVNGRNLGSDVMFSRQQDISVYELDLLHIKKMIKKRNEALGKVKDEATLLNTKKKLSGKALAVCRAKLKALTVAAPDLRADLNALHSAWKNNDKSKSDKAMGAMESKLLAKRTAAAMPEGFEEKFRSGLEDLKELTENSVKANKETGEYQERYDRALLEFRKHNESLRNDLKNLSPAMYRFCREKLTGDLSLKVFPSDFYRQIPQAELLKDIKVEIIRKERP